MGTLKGLLPLFILASGFLVSSAQKTVCTQEALADIVFLVDGSWSIGTENFQKIRDFLFTLVNSFDVGPDKVQIGLVQYSNSPHTEFYLNSFDTRQKILDYITKLTYRGGGTKTGLGLNFLLTQHFIKEAGSRAGDGVPQLAVVITDGQSQDNVEVHAQDLKHKGIILYAIGIKDADLEQLGEIATQPHEQHIYGVSDFTALEGISQSFIQVLCKTVEEAKRQVSKIPQGEGCKANLADIVFLVDSSSSIGDADFLHVKKFLQKFIEGLDVKPDKVRLGLAQFSNDPKQEFLLGEYVDKNDLLEKVKKLTYLKGGTETGKALTFIQNNYFTEAGGSRINQSVPQIAVVITDGDSADTMDIPAMELRRKGVLIYTIGVGEASIKDLQSIANKPHQRFVLSFTDYEDLLKATANTVDKVCISVEAQQQALAPKFSDVFVLVDSSVEQPQKVIQMLNRIANQLNVRNTPNQLALAQFGEDVSVAFRFDGYKTKNEAIALIRKFQLKGQGQKRKLGKAMDYVRTHLLNTAAGSRIAQGNKQYLLVVSKGESDDNILRAARALKDEEVTLINYDFSKELVFSAPEVPGPRVRTSPTVTHTHGIPAKNKNANEISNEVKTFIETKETVTVTGDCKSAELADIVFIVDVSDSISVSNFKLVRDFLHRMINGLNVNRTDSVRVGMVLYSDTPTAEFYLNTFDYKEDILQYIKLLPFRGGKSSTSKALKFAREKVFTSDTGSRRAFGVQQIAIVITEGDSLDNVTVQATALRRSGVQVYALGVTKDNVEQLKEIASYPSNRFVFSVENFSKLNAMERILRKTLCNNVVRSAVDKSSRYTLKQGCIQTEEADIYFLIDHSGSIYPSDFQDMKKFILEFLLLFKIGPKQVRVGVVKFASNPTLEFTLDRYDDRASIERAVDSIVQIGGGTQTGQALSFMSPLFKAAERTRGTKVQEILLVITDGKSQDEVKNSAAQLRAQGVTIYAIGVKEANEQELLEMAADPKRMYYVTNFDALKPLKNEIVTDICSEEACKNMLADIIFLVDGSGSIEPVDFSKMQKFINNIISKSIIGKDSVRVGVVQFSTTAKVEFALSKFWDKKEMQQAVNDMAQPGGGTMIGEALFFVSEYFDPPKGGRPSTPQILIVITDGESQDDVALGAETLRNKGITIYSIGVLNANSAQLQEISGNQNNVYMERDFDALDSLDKDLLLKICTSVKDCQKSQVADVVFLVDDSSSITHDAFTSMKFFMNSVVNNTEVGKDNVRFCTILYSDEAETKFPLNQYYSKREVRDAIRILKHHGGNTYTAKSLLYSLKYFSEAFGGRGIKGIPQMLFVITDGEATDPHDLPKAADELHKLGVSVYGIGVADAKTTELETITKDEKKIFKVDDFEALKALQFNISSVICNNTKPECKKESADLVILIDGSESIKKGPWAIMIHFMLSLIDNLRIHPDLFRVGVAQFSTNYGKEFYLNEFDNEVDVKKAIEGIKQMKDGTYIGKALDQVQEFFHASKGSRIQEGISQNLLLITDGESNDCVKNASDTLRARGIQMFVIGIGEISMSQLNYIAGSSERLFYADNFDHLKLSRTTQEVVSSICTPSEQKSCTIDIGIGFDISHSSTRSLFGSQYSLRVYLPEIVRYISTLQPLCCLPEQPALQNNVGFRLVASDGNIVHDVNFEHYNEDTVKKVLAYESQHLAFNTNLLRSFQNKFATSGAGVKILIIFTDGLDESVVGLTDASRNLQNSGVHALMTVALEGLRSTTELQNLEFGRGVGYNEPLMIGMQNVASALQKQIDAVASRECCDVMCKCTGHEGVRGPHGRPGIKGALGWPGHPGFPGDEGGVGDRGTPGPNGSQGHPGCHGRRGPKGGRGYRGDNGKDGEHGLDGVNGEHGVTGLAGHKGEPGDSGSPGKKGIRGFQGQKGQKGLRGDPGDPGFDSNIRGPKGEIGNPGLPGEPGPDGSPGRPGDTGSPGQQGRRGAAGQTGNKGRAGENGLNGSPGFSGPEGPVGPAGSPGQKGITGFPGPQGPPGTQGSQGSKGSVGPRGPKGQSGEPGNKGEIGPPGPRGTSGNDGPDGYGFPGPKGQKGDPGFPGYPGLQGEFGDNGRKGDNGPKGQSGRGGNAGRPGGQGAPGDNGRPGHRGPKGPPGTREMSTCQLINRIRDNCVCCKDKAACPVYPTELVIGLDMSDDVTPTLFGRMHSTLLSLLESIDISESNCPTGTRVSVVSYSSNTKYLIRFSDYRRKKDLVEAVKNIPLKRTSNRRHIGEAMQFVGRNVFKRIRQGVLIRKVAIFLSGGQSEDVTSITSAVLEYKALDINLGVIGFRDTPNVQRAFQADETGSFILSVVGTSDTQSALGRIQQCVICYDPCNPARDCPSTSEASTSKEVNVDLALLVDGSRNIQADQYEGVKQVLSTLLDQLVVSSQPSRNDRKARVALYQQSSSYSEAQGPVKQIFTFQQFQNRNLMKQSMFENLQQTGGYSRLDQAMEFVIMKNLLTVSNPRKYKMVLLVVGEETEYSDIAKLDFIIRKAKCQGVVILTLAVGDHFNSTLLEELSSFPAEQHVVHIGHVKQGEQEYARRFLRTFLHILSRALNIYPFPLFKHRCEGFQQETVSVFDAFETVQRPPIQSIPLTARTYTEDTEKEFAEEMEEDTDFSEQGVTQMEAEHKTEDGLYLGPGKSNAECLLHMDSGTVCEEYVKRWYYDSEVGACLLFWYGGCDGNNNRFSTEIECRKTCVLSTTDVCFLKMDDGPCRNYVLKWFYDQNQKQCIQFWYGGCDGNLNRFDTREQCEIRCVDLPTVQ